MALKTDARSGLDGNGAGKIGGGVLAAGGPLIGSNPTTAHPTCQVRRPLFDASGHCVGVILGDVLSKSVDASRHFLKGPPAIALDAVAVAEAERLGVQRVDVLDRETNRRYTLSLADFLAHSWTLNRGYGLQRAMRLSRWTVDGDEPAPAVTAPGPVAVQLELFG